MEMAFSGRAADEILPDSEADSRLSANSSKMIHSFPQLAEAMP